MAYIDFPGPNCEGKRRRRRSICVVDVVNRRLVELVAISKFLSAMRCLSIRCLAASTGVQFAAVDMVWYIEKEREVGIKDLIYWSSLVYKIAFMYSVYGRGVYTNA